MPNTLLKVNTHILPNSLSSITNFADIDIDSDPYVFTENEIEDIKSIIGSDIDESNITVITKDDLLKNQYQMMIKEGFTINNQLTSFNNTIKMLHKLGDSIMDRNTNEAIILHVSEIGNTEEFKEFWVHYFYLSTQSFLFFKLFDQYKNSITGQQQPNIIEIEVPSLKTFPYILELLYTGNIKKLYSIANSDESLYKGIMENIYYLDINMSLFSC